MKNMLLFTFAVIAAVSLRAQCISVTSVEWGAEQFTVNGTINEPYTLVSLASELVLENNETFNFSVVFPIEKADNSFNFALINGAEECSVIFDPDESTYFNAEWVEANDPSNCDATDGTLCLTDYEGNPVDFTIDGFASSGGCIGGLSSGSHQLSPAAINSSDGVTYINPEQTIDMLELNVVLTEQGGLLVPSISGGSGDYTWFINNAPVNEGIPAQFKGCAVVDVTDMVTGCKAVKTEYLTSTIKGDLTGSTAQSPGDGCVITSDLLAMLGFMGPTSTAADFDCDGVTNMSDLLFFLTRFGTGDCGF